MVERSPEKLQRYSTMETQDIGNDDIGTILYQALIAVSSLFDCTTVDCTHSGLHPQHRKQLIWISFLLCVCACVNVCAVMQKCVCVYSIVSLPLCWSWRGHWNSSQCSCVTSWAELGGGLRLSLVYPKWYPYNLCSEQPPANLMGLCHV